MKFQCANSECNVTWNDEEDNRMMYCSVECAVYDGAFSVRTGWNKDVLEEKKQGRRSDD